MSSMSIRFGLLTTMRQLVTVVALMQSGRIKKTRTLGALCNMLGAIYLPPRIREVNDVVGVVVLGIVVIVFGAQAVAEWWRQYWCKHDGGVNETIWGAADGVLFLKGRPHFHYVDGRRADFNSGAPIALVAYGRDNLTALMQSGLGFVVVGHNAKVRGDAPLYGAASLSTDGLGAGGNEE